MIGISTPGINQNLDPSQWAHHLFGLPLNRWRGISNKSFWITGSGTGYGRSLAVALASTGAQVFLTGRRESKLVETIKTMESLGISINKCHIVQADLTNYEQIKKACVQVENLCDSLYGLINNAALPSRATIPLPLQNESLAHWDRLLKTNLTAPWLLTREIFPHMKKGGAARILFLSSEAGWAFTSGFGPYNVSKAALNNLAGSMAAEYSSCFPDMDIQMNVLVPGEAHTEMNQTSQNSPYSIINMSLILLSHPPGGPNGKFFHRDGRHLEFAYSSPFDQPLL